MNRKFQILFSAMLFSSVVFAQQDSVRIQKAVLLFYDSTDIAPVIHRIPYIEATEEVMYVSYKNVGQRSLLNYSIEYRILGGRAGVIDCNAFTQDSIAIGEEKDFKLSLSGPWAYRTCIFGKYKTEFIIADSTGAILDSSSFVFEMTDTSYSKSNISMSSMGTGPGLFLDTVTNQAGGTVQGDRFGTLFEVNNLLGGHGSLPTSLSMFIINDTSNIGAEVRPKIWSVYVDSSTNKIVVGQEMASSFIPFTVGSSNLGQLITMPLDNGAAVITGLNSGKYMVGFESTLPNPNGKSLLIGRDSIGEALQPSGTSFVYFGQDTNWYSINHLPLIKLHFGALPFGWMKPCAGGCSTVSVNDIVSEESSSNIYPNPSKGIFTLDNLELIQTMEIYNVNGQKINVELVNEKLDLSEQPVGIYLLRVQLVSGKAVLKKLVKL